MLLPGFNADYLHDLIQHFKKDIALPDGIYLIESNSPVQSLVIPGNKKAKDVASQLRSLGFDVRAITSPSVAAGQERLRISLHLHNKIEEVDSFKNSLQKILFS